MYRQSIPLLGSYQAWRGAALRFLEAGVPPEDILWSEEMADAELFGSSFGGEAPRSVVRVTASFVDCARLAICHRSGERFALLYRLLWRLRSESRLMDDQSDPLVAALRGFTKAVSRDSHKMKAFVRFQEIQTDQGSGRRRFAAWFEPSHHVTELTAPFFARRFADMDWAIATPDVTARCVGGELTMDRTMLRPDAVPDRTADLWRTYYASIFNPARLKVKAMTAEMPKKYWKNLPEAALIPGLIAKAAGRAAEMQAAAPTMPSRRIPKADHIAIEDDAGSIAALKTEAATCERCGLCRMATQTVFGEGPDTAQVMLVGEQPGDREDLEGRPFVGPAGQLLDKALAAASISRSACYLTNAVKHFKYEPRGKFRLHKSPDRGEVENCHWWLSRELAIIQPRLVIALGATAALSLTGNGASILRRRGTVEQSSGLPPVLITMHPSSILRSGGEAQQQDAYGLFVKDLQLAVAALQNRAAMPDVQI
jgi:uracil-DNA glycosylase